MSGAYLLYGLWSGVVLAAVVLWVASRRRWTMGGRQVARMGALVGAAVARRWVRVALVLVWAWIGVHTFAR